MSKISQQKPDKKPLSDKVKHYLILIFLPFLLLFDKTGKDKTGHILTGIFAVCFIIFLITLIMGKANVICVFGIIAIDAWGWLMYIISKNDNFLK